MKTWIVAVAAFIGVLGNGVAVADGNVLLAQCQIVLRNSPDAESSEALDAGLCLGYIQGVRQTMKVYSSALPKKDQTCIPEGMTNGQGARVVVKYLEDHPKDLHLPEILLTMAAYREAYPCGN